MLGWKEERGSKVQKRRGQVIVAGTTVVTVAEVASSAVTLKADSKDFIIGCGLQEKKISSRESKQAALEMKGILAYA